MIIGFDVSQTGRAKAGCGYFADSLLRHLVSLDHHNDYILYPTFGNGVWDAEWPQATLRPRASNVRRGLGHRLADELDAFWRNPPADLEQQLGRPDVIQSNNFFCPPQLARARLVYTLHDLAFLEYPGWTTEDNRITCFTGVFNAAITADRVVAVSDYTRRHFLQLFPHYPADRVSVVHEASRFPDSPPASRPSGLPPLTAGEFWLAAGTLEPRKNHPRLLRAFARLPRSRPLVLVGGRGWMMEDFDSLLDELDLRRDVHVLGYVSDQALQWLYANCWAFVYPSLFEGFGLPVVEAMSMGAAVITSNTTSLPEVAGDAAVLVDPIDEDALLDAMHRLDVDQAEVAELRRRGLARAAAFSWDRAATQMLELYERVVGERPVSFGPPLAPTRS